MKHARADYDRFQDPSGKVPNDEPVYILRGQDKLSPFVLDFYARLAADAGLDPALVEATRKQAAAMREWQRTKVAKMPDLFEHHPDPVMNSALTKLSSPNFEEYLARSAGRDIR